MYCVEKYGVCSTDEKIVEYFKDLEYWEKEAGPIAFYAKVAEWVAKDPNVVVPELPIKNDNPFDRRAFIAKIVAFLTYWILHRQTPIQLYVTNKEATTVPVEHSTEIMVVPTLMDWPFIPIKMQILAEFLENGTAERADLGGIWVKKS